MTKAELAMNANPVVAFLQKPTEEFTKADIIRFIEANEVKMVNFMYPADDGKLKTLNFVITNRDYLETILTCGERVDGSSLFSFIEAGSSDLYVLPRFSTAFLDPFAEIPTLCMLCSYFDKDGNPLASSPENTLRKACRAFRETTGMEFYAMGELEYYVIDEDPEVFPAIDQHGYHESAPYAKMNDFRQQCMLYVAQTGGEIKYGHSEVGNFTEDGLLYEQNEIEFLPVYAGEMGNQEPGIRDGAQRDVRPEDHRGQGRKRAAHTHAHGEGRQEPDARWRETEHRSAQGHRRNDGPGREHHRLWQQEPNVIFPPRASSGSTDKRLLGRPQPQRARQSAARMDSRHRPLPRSKPAGAGGHRRHIGKADGGDALTGRQRRPVPTHRRPLRGMPPWLRDGQRARSGRQHIRQRQHTRCSTRRQTQETGSTA